MPLMDKLQKVTQDVVRGTKDFTDTARLNSLITDEQKQVENLYSQIGKLYFESSEPDSETPIGKLCMALKAANERITKYNNEIRQIKGTKRCPSCGADMPLISSFCGSCGSKIEQADEMQEEAPEAKKFCSGCGAEISENSAFCTSCGQKQE